MITCSFGTPSSHYQHGEGHCPSTTGPITESDLTARHLHQESTLTLRVLSEPGSLSLLPPPFSKTLPCYATPPPPLHRHRTARQPASTPSPPSCQVFSPTTTGVGSQPGSPAHTHPIILLLSFCVLCCRPASPPTAQVLGRVFGWGLRWPHILVKGNPQPPLRSLKEVGGRVELPPNFGRGGSHLQRR